MQLARAEASPPLGDAGLDLLPSKVAQPRLPPSYISRPSVDDLLTEGATRPVTVVSAGAGWGKTLVTAGWAASRRAPSLSAWISLDAPDNEPGRFWSCFVSALREVGAVPRLNLLAGLVPGLGDREENFRRLLSGLGALPRTVVVILDDFHHITDPVVLGQLTELLRRPPPHLRLILLTRVDPSLPLHRLRVADDLTEIRPRDLAFDAGDAARLLAAHDVAVAPADAATLVERTEGWPAGLRLAALFLSRTESGRTVRDFTGDDRAVSTYLAEEVLESLSPELRRFLLRTSIVDRLTSDLAATLTGQRHCQQHLEDLEASNAFVVGLGPGRDWFRYHALLREMLRHRLLVAEPDLVSELHRLAAQWFGAHGYPLDALRHAADAQDWPLVGEIFVSQAGHLMLSAQRSAMGMVLTRIPAEHLNTDLNLTLCAAARVWLTGRFQDMPPYLDTVGEQLATEVSQPSSGTLVAYQLLSTAVSRTSGDTPAVVQAATEALDALSGPGGSLPAAAAYRAIALNLLGTGRLWSGDVTGARECLDRALPATGDTGVEAAQINVLSHLALAAAISGRTDDALADGMKAIELVDARGWAPLPQAACAYLAVAMVRFQLNETELAGVLLEQAQEAGHQEFAARCALGLVRAQQHASAGRVEAARVELRRVEPDLDARDDAPLLARWRSVAEAEIDLAAGVPSAVSSRFASALNLEPPFLNEQICLARSDLALGRNEEAEERLRSLREAADGASTLIDVWLLTAVVADRQRQDRKAIEALRKAIDLARSTGVRRPFLVLEPDVLARLLSQLRDLSPDLEDVIERLLSAMGRRQSNDLGILALTDPLTDREMSVLQFLPTMMTNAEIAAELYVSLNTVKAHLKKIFRKLAVTNRRQAVQRARQIGLLE